MADTTHMLSHSTDECTSSSIKMNAADVMVSGYGTGADDSSLSSSPTTSMATSVTRAVHRRDQHEAFSNTSSGGDTSSAASSIEFFPFMPDHLAQSSSLTPDPVTSLNSSTSTDLEPSTTHSPSVNLSPDIDDYMMSMLNIANELSTFSATDCSNSSSLKRFRAKASHTNPVNSRKALPPLRSPRIVGRLPADDPQNLKADCDDGNRDLKNPPTQNEVLLEAESLLRELDMTAATYSTSSQKSTPSFAAIDDNYTTNEYVSFVRERSMRNKLKPPGGFDRRENFLRTTTWAANVAPSPPPPLPITNVPGTPIVSRYRMKTGASIRVRPNTAEPPSLPTSAKTVSENEYFSHSEENPAYVSSLNRKASWLLKNSNFKVRQPNGSKPEVEYVANYVKKPSEAEKRLKPLTIHNFAPTLPIADSASANTSISSYSNDSEPHTSRFPPGFADTGFKGDACYIDQMPADQVDVAREKAFQFLGKHLQEGVLVKVKQWSQKLYAIKNFFSRFSRATSEIPVDGLFGMPLSTVQAEHGNGKAFPQFILDIMAFLSKHAPVVDGMFRRCGSKKRILEMRTICHALKVQDHIPEDMLTLNQINDLTDLMKQYLRALPERLVNDEITQAVANIVTSGHSEKQQIQLLKCAMMILLDDQRDAFFVLIDFLGYVASKSTSNFMTVDNLVVCTLPTIFYQNETAAPANQTRRSRNKTVGPLNLQEAEKYTALRVALNLMIKNREEMRLIPTDLLGDTSPRSQRKKKNPLPPLSATDGARTLASFVHDLCNQMDDGWKYWVSEVVDERGTVFATRDVDDDVPLKSNRIQTFIDASPRKVYEQLAEYRTQWDGLVLHMHRYPSNGVEELWKADFAVFGDGVTKNATLTCLSKANMYSGVAFIGEKSTRTGYGHFNENVDVFHNVILIHPHRGGSLVNHIVRMDIKGKSTIWYEKTFKHLLISRICRVKEMLKTSSLGSNPANF